jgi:hypothetical protein
MTKAEMERENQLANEAWEAIVKFMNEPADAVNVSVLNVSKEGRPREQDGIVKVDQGSLIGKGASAMDKVLNQVEPHAIGSRLFATMSLVPQIMCGCFDVATHSTDSNIMIRCYQLFRL